jgi:hypothetical protein
MRSCHLPACSFSREGVVLVIWGVVETIAAMAILLALVYVAVQIKHSADASKIAPYQQAIAQIGLVVMDPDFSILKAKFDAGEVFSDVESIRSTLLSTHFIEAHEILLFLCNAGQLDERLWQNTLENNLAILKSDMMFSVLSDRPGSLSCELLRLVENRRT